MVLKKKHERQKPLTPMDLKYMKTVKFCLYILGAWPFAELYEVYGEKPKNIPLRHFKTLTVFWTVILLSGGTYIVTNTGKIDFFEIGHSYITFFTNAISIQRVMMPFQKCFRNTISEFVLKIHLFHHKSKSKYAMEVSDQVDKMSRLFTIWLYTLMCCGVLLFNLPPIYHNIKSGVFKTRDHSLENGTLYELSLYHYIPFEYHNFGYTIIALVNVILIFDGYSCLCTYDLLMSVIIFHMWGHLKILKHNLENFPKPKQRTNNPGVFYDEDESQHIKKLIIMNIEHHKLIMEFVSLASDGFGLMMCCYYTYHQVVGCILLLEVSPLDAAAIAHFGIPTVIVFQQLIQISIVFELLGSKSETIKDAVYSLPWECMDVKNRKLVLFFLYNAQKPITLKALGMVSVGVQTAAAIIKTSMSYFLMLRTLTEN